MNTINRREFCKGAAGIAGIVAAGYLVMIVNMPLGKKFAVKIIMIVI